MTHIKCVYGAFDVFFPVISSLEVYKFNSGQQVQIVPESSRSSW